MLKLKCFLAALITTLAILNLCPWVYAKISYVPQDYPTIQSAIDASSSGDAVMVSAGTYVGNITIKSGVILQGAGYSTTILDGGGVGNVVTVEDGGEISGFSIVNADKEVFYYSGIYCLKRAVIKNNYIHAGCYFGINDTAGDSGGAGDIDVSGNIIIGHLTGINVRCGTTAKAIIAGNILCGDKENGTTGIYVVGTPAQIRNNTVLYYGGGIDLYSTSSSAENNILAYNNFYAIYGYGSSSSISSYNDAYGNGSTPCYKNIMVGQGCIYLDPLFTDLSGGDYTLQVGSPCVNAGNPDLLYNDRDGSRNDIGAYGGPNGILAGDDASAPSTSNHIPAKGAINIDDDTVIKFDVYDDFSGIDLSSVKITVEAERVYDGSNPAAYPQTVVSGEGKRYTFIYTPAVKFVYGQVVNVTVEASDLRGNVMPQDKYSFTIMPNPEKLVNWQIEMVDPSVMSCFDTAIAVDSKDKVHIVYLDTVSFGLTYVTNAGGQWESTVIDTVMSPDTIPVMAIDSNNGIHVAYMAFDMMGAYMKYAVKSGPQAQWAVEAIEGPAMTIFGLPSIAVDSVGNAYVTYVDSMMGCLRYAVNNSGSWAVSDIDTDIGPAYYSAIAIDSDDKAHVVYITVGRGTIYANNISGQWIYEVIDNSELSSLSLAIDSNNKIHFAGDHPGKKEVGYMTNASGSWVYMPVDNYMATWMDVKLAVDSQAKAHIAYREGEVDSSRLKYATNINGVWDSNLLENGGQASAIAVDSADNIHISYFNGFVEPIGLKHAYGIYNLSGDVNGDNQIDVLDIQCTVNHILEIQNWWPSADVNRDNSIDVIDIQLIVNKILG